MLGQLLFVIEEQQFGEPGFFLALAMMELYWQRSMLSSEWSVSPSQLQNRWHARSEAVATTLDLRGRNRKVNSPEDQCQLMVAAQNMGNWPVS